MPRTLLLLLAATALAAPVATPARAALERTEPFTGIRPGVVMIANGRCTTGFVFQTSGHTFDASQQLYVGTAAHCVHAVGETVTFHVTNPVTGTTVDVAAGTVDVTGTGGPAADFALVKIDMAYNSWVSPTLVQWGGPVGVDTTATAGTPVRCIGHPKGVDESVPRSGVVSSRTANVVEWTCPVISGDSGGPVATADGLALAAVAEAKPGGKVQDTVWGAGATGPSIQAMEAIGGRPVATCASLQPWTQPGCPAQ